LLAEEVERGRPNLLLCWQHSRVQILNRRRTLYPDGVAPWQFCLAGRAGVEDGKGVGKTIVL
jgi:hypothetical protein